MNDPAERLEKTRNRIAEACRAAGRAPGEVRLLAVSKTHPAEQVRAFAALGQLEFGENRLEEALEKQARLGDLRLVWHFIGHIQSRKTADVARRFDWVQSADREKVLRRLSAQRPKGAPPLNVCIQVNIDREPQKAGANPEETAELARLCLELPGLELRGLMCIPRIASASYDPADSYARMFELYRSLRNDGLPLDTLSMGMSADLEAAVRHGSTMIRIGTDLFGPRPPAGD